MKTRFRPFQIGLLTGAAVVLPLFLPAARAQTGPIITQQPANQTNLAGANVTLSVAVSGAGPFNYQWQFNGTNLPNDIITTVAGNGTNGYAGDGGAATNAELGYPDGVAVDASGSLFIADQANSRVRRVDTNGIIATVAGYGSIGYSGNGGPATNAGLGNPSAVGVDASDNLFIADTLNNVIRKVGTNGVISTVAGDGHSGFSGDGGPATNASLYNPFGLALDASGDLFISDDQNCRVRKVSANGVITTVAGNGTQGFSGDGGAAVKASLRGPYGLAVDASGNLFIADQGNGRVRKVDTNGIITTVAGGGTNNPAHGGAATNVFMYQLDAVGVDGTGSLLVGDGYNHCVRKVDSSGLLTTIAGNGSGQYSGDGGPATNAGLSISDLALSPSGDLFIPDGNNRVREVHLSGIPTLTLDDLSPASAGPYQVIVSSPYGSVTSVIAALTVLAPPSIVTQPVNAAVAVGGAAMFDVVASGSQPLSYAWFFNGAEPIQTGTNSTLSLPKASLSQEGTYSVVVTNSFGSVTSRAAILSVAYPPAIVVEPANQTVLVGGQAALHVTVAGVGPFAYQWRLNGANLPNNLIMTVAGGGFGDGGAATVESLNGPWGVAADSSGDLFITDSGHNRVCKLDAAGVITTVAGGNSSGGFSGDGGPAADALLSAPWGVALDASGNLFIVDSGNRRVRRIDLSGVITTVAGNGTNGYSGDGGPATEAGIVPAGVAVDSFGNLLIADYGNNRVRKVDANGIITTLAGNGKGGYLGDGGAAANATLNYPTGVAADPAGNVFIADSGNDRIRKVATNGVITTVAGGAALPFSGDGGQATNAGLNNPSAVALDSAGNFFIADENNWRVRKVTTNGIITTVAGNGSAAYSGDGGPATQASLYNPSAVALEASGNIFIADYSNNRIRKINANGIITTVAGNGATDYSGDGGPATNAGLNDPAGVAVDASGNLFIADENNARIRQVGPNGTITTVAGDGTSAFAGDGGPATNAGLNHPLGLAVDAAGDLFIAAQGNNRIRELGLAGTITTVAGTGSTGFTGDGGAATNARLSSPSDVSVDDSGNLFIADTSVGRIRKVGLNGIIATVAGDGSAGFFGDGGAATNASLSTFGVAADFCGNFFIADELNNRVRKVDNEGIITTLAGNGSPAYAGDGGAATNAGLSKPSAVAVDAAGDVFVADSGNNRIREIDVNGIISTTAGNGSPGYSGDGGAATNAGLNSPSALALDAAGNMFIADSGNNRVREVALAGLPGLSLGEVSAASAGDYQVIITTPYGSVTSSVATLTVAAPPVIVMNPPTISSVNLVLGFNISNVSRASFTLLQTPSLTVAWMTNTSAVLTTNAQAGGFQFTLPTSGSTGFYRVRSP